MTSALAGFSEVARLRGAWRAPLVAAAWLVRPSWEVYLHDDGTRLGASAAALAGLRLEAVDESNLARAAALQPGATLDSLRARLAEGQRGTLVLAGDEPVHVGWISLADVALPYLGLTLALGPGDHYAGSAYTRVDRRGDGLFTGALAHNVAAARAEGAPRMIGIVARWNAPSRRAVRRIGSRGPVGAVGYWRLGPVRRYFASGAVRLLPGRRFRVETAA